MLEEETHQRELREGRVAPDVWEANFAYLRGKLEALGGEGRELQDRIEEQRLQLADARLELGRFEGTGGVRLRDVVVDVITSGTGAAALEVEYVVGNAGWQPYYDLRARKDLSVVELAYRAKVWQRSGEDWREAAILLSTAQPQRGAQGPEPQPVWLSLLDPSTARMTGARRRSMSDVVGSDSDAAPEKSMPAEPPPFAAVQSEGLSVRFRLPRAETIESRDQPTTVLIGRADLVVTPEHYCVPALDPTVWLRARTVNTSDWVMLPGRAAVYFGADYLGHAWLEAVQLEQDFTVHLGPDPGLVVERTQIEDLKEGSGLFSSKESLRESWRIRVENHGAYSNRADGAVDVIVHESLPRPRDDRIEVTIDKVRPRPREDERWKKEREEKGILTWILRVQRGGELTIELTTEIGYPESMSLVRH